MDRFRVEVIAKTPNPQQVIYAAMHQDYSEDFVVDEKDTWPSEAKSGEIIVKRLLAGDRGHYGPIEHPSIVFNCGYFPHSVMQQIRTHRVGLCLAGDTEVAFGHPSLSTGEMYYSESVSSLYELWHFGRKHQRSPADAAYMRKQIQRRSILVLNTETNQLEQSKITNIYCNGEKQVLEISTATGEVIKATEDHLFWTNQGWKKVKEFDENTLVCRIGFQGNAAKSIEPLLSIACNRGVFTEICNICPVEMTMTYDIEVEHKHHNFIANGLVVHNSFDVQSNRYTGNRIVDAAAGKRELEEVFYLRPVGSYTDRQGKRYQYTKEQRDRDLAWCLEAAKRYQQLIAEGAAEEHARGIIPFDVRQHWVMSLNVRSLMHLLDMRWKKDAQLECQKLCDLIWPHFQEWVPEIAKWYFQNRAKKSRLSP